MTNEAHKTWTIGYRYNPSTGSVKPWEVVNTVIQNDKVTAIVQWSSFKTEAAAAASIPKAIARMEAEPIYCENKTFVNVGRMN